MYYQSIRTAIQPYKNNLFNHVRNEKYCEDVVLNIKNNLLDTFMCLLLFDE